MIAACLCENPPQGAKYKRRWVEVTAATVVYAPSQQDVLTGNIQVFATADMLWIKPEADTKLQVCPRWPVFERNTA